MALINKHKLCFNCLEIYRIATYLTSKRCLKYRRKHQTSIHPGSANSTKAKVDSETVMLATKKKNLLQNLKKN